MSLGAFLDSLGRGQAGRSVSKLHQAQDVTYRAMEEPNRWERVRMAHRALGISLECADAYVILARDDTDRVEEALWLYRKAVQAGRKALGEKAFEEYVGHFWGVPETRPFMRAHMGFASCLWAVGEREEAVKHYQDMLILNPDDNQGVRYILMPCLVELGRDEEAEELFRSYEDDGSTFWAYSRALLDFRREGESPVSEKSLKEAWGENPHVPEYLTGRRRVPKRLPDDCGFGDSDEAVIYVSENLPAWKASPGALEWLKEKTRKR